MSLWVFLGFKFGDWRNYKKYYPTIQFMALGDLIYCLVFYKKHLWTLQSDILLFPYLDFITIITTFAFSVLLYLTHYPHKGNYISQAVYIAFWVLLYTFLELALSFLGVITYDNGWILAYSLIHNIYQFIYLRIHHSNPMIAWILAFATLAIAMIIFKIPVLKIK
jgi:hypothetical protein